MLVTRHGSIIYAIINVLIVRQYSNVRTLNWIELASTNVPNLSFTANVMLATPGSLGVN